MYVRVIVVRSPGTEIRGTNSRVWREFMNIVIVMMDKTIVLTYLMYRL